MDYIETKNSELIDKEIANIYGDLKKENSLTHEAVKAAKNCALKDFEDIKLTKRALGNYITDFVRGFETARS